jgi:hypothetical protein
MRIFLVLICSIALASIAGAQEPKGKEKEKKRGAPAGQVSKPSGKPAGKPAGVGKPVGKPSEMGKPSTAGTAKGRPSGVGKPTEVGKAKGHAKPTEVSKPVTAGKAKGRPSEVGKPTEVGKPAVTGKEKGKPATAGKAKGKPSEFGKPTEVGKPAAAGKLAKGSKPTVAGKPFKPQHFNLASKNKPSTSVAPAVTFQQNRRIAGAQNWQGSNYTVFRNYTATWHDRTWWRSHYNRVVFVFGGWYYWNAGWWYPAWGYAPDAYYAYDGPIYGYNDLPPDQVVANVQAALQEQGYYRGDVDGVLGPLTRAAIADYQRDHGLYMTSAIDRPTLESLGMA